MRRYAARHSARFNTQILIRADVSSEQHALFYFPASRPSLITPPPLSISILDFIEPPNAIFSIFSRARFLTFPGAIVTPIPYYATIYAAAIARYNGLAEEFVNRYALLTLPLFPADDGRCY